MDPQDSTSTPATAPQEPATAAPAAPQTPEAPEVQANAAEPAQANEALATGLNPEAVEPTVEALTAEIERLKKAADDADKKARVGSKENARAELLAELTKALGGETTDEAPAPTVESVTATLTEREAALRSLAVENAVLKQGANLGANVERLLDSRSFERSIAALDTTADDFADQVTSAIKSALEADATLRKAPVASASGPAIPGGDTPPTTPADTPEAFLKARQNRGR